MALTDESAGGIPATMLVSPSGYSGAPASNGFGGWGGDGWWIILLLLAFNGGWGGYGGFGGGYGNMMLGYDFPWLLNGQNAINANTNAGFRDSMLNDSITSVRDGISALATQLCGCCGDISTQLCNGFNGVTNAVASSQAAIAQQMYANQIADLERSFAAQTASTQGMSAIQAQLAQCCCDNRSATQDLKYTLATEACATRAASTQNTQAILDKLCQLELDNYKSQLNAKDDIIAQLRQENIFARGQASQVTQTADIRANNATVANQLISELRSCPIPAQPVYGSQPIFTCGGSNSACSCGSF